MMHAQEVVVPCQGSHLGAFDDTWWVRAGGDGGYTSKGERAAQS